MQHYLDSLNTLLVLQNPFLEFAKRGFKTVRALWNMQRNRKRAESKLIYLNQKLDTLDTMINCYGPTAPHRFDVNR